MALSEDQRALLRLLLAGDTYERVAEVLGTSADQVRRRAQEAATVLETDGDPELQAEAVRARLEALEGASRGEPALDSAEPPDDRHRRLALRIVGGGAVLVLLVVLLVVGIGGDGDGEENRTTAAGDEEAVPVRLSPVGGSQASGGLTIIRIGDQPAVDLDIRGLVPTGEGETYVLWFVGSGGRSLPVAFQAVGPNGRITGRTAIPTAAASLLPDFETADLTLTRQREAAAAVQQAAQSGTLPQRVGTSVLRGPLG
jgi:DNA-binding CsgD family transcriptional regulator